MLRVRDLTIAFDEEPILEGVDLDVPTGKFVSLVGPSGSGKTSILRAIAGLLEPRDGTVDVEAGRREIGFLFQDDALLPWRTAIQNVSLGLKIRGQSESEARETAQEWLSLVGLERFGDRYPRQLSGGQRKRVALAQVLALDPEVLLMDEPFAAVDAIVRTRLMEEMLGWVEQEELTVLLVTHDLEEAITASDTIYVLGQGPRADILARHEVDIERPRHVVDSRKHPAFGPLLERLWDQLSDELPDS